MCAMRREKSTAMGWKILYEGRVGGTKLERILNRTVYFTWVEKNVFFFPFTKCDIPSSSFPVFISRDAKNNKNEDFSLKELLVSNSHSRE